MSRTLLALTTLAALAVFAPPSFAGESLPAPASPQERGAEQEQAAGQKQAAEQEQAAGQKQAAEQEQAAEPDPAAEQAPNGLLVFLDCERRDCDLDYLRREITFINYVRDRRDGQIHVLVTTRRGGAGEEFTFAFIGLREFEGDDVTYTYVASNTNTEDETRAGIAQMIRVGVLHYLVKTPLIDQIEIRQEVREIGDRFLVVDPADDPWNFWVLRFGLNGSLGGEDRRSNRNLFVNMSGNRTTEDWKIRLRADLFYNDRKFVLNDGRESSSFTRTTSFTGQVVKSLGPNWGASIKGSVIEATFVNLDRTAVVAPGIEYNIFPYAESSRRSFTITYEVSAGYYNYIEETIFLQTSELLYDHGVEVDFNAVQPWGEAEFGIVTAQFFNDLSQWRMALEGDLEFRVVRGLNFNVRGSWAAIRDQRFLPAEGQTDEEILLERRALATNSRYRVSFGFSYTFGSIFNNVVNPRFSGGRADFNRFF